MWKTCPLMAEDVANRLFNLLKVLSSIPGTEKQTSKYLLTFGVT